MGLSQSWLWSFGSAWTGVSYHLDPVLNGKIVEGEVRMSEVGGFDLTAIIPAVIALLVAILNAWNQRKNRVITDAKVQKVEGEVFEVKKDMDGRLNSLIVAKEIIAHAEGMKDEKTAQALRDAAVTEALRAANHTQFEKEKDKAPK